VVIWVLLLDPTSIVPVPPVALNLPPWPDWSLTNYLAAHRRSLCAGFLVGKCYGREKCTVSTRKRASRDQLLAVLSLENCSGHLPNLSGRLAPSSLPTTSTTTGDHHHCTTSFFIICSLLPTGTSLVSVECLVQRSFDQPSPSFTLASTPAAPLL
jgi:hypothetical protein